MLVDPRVDVSHPVSDVLPDTVPFQLIVAVADGCLDDVPGIANRFEAINVRGH